MRLFNRKKYIDLQVIEDRLSATLLPVIPRQEFVRDLRSRLMAHAANSTPDLVIRQEPAVSRGWILAGGVAGGLLVLIMSIRGILSIAGLIGVFVQQRKQPASQPAN
jgi:hypothetical protein